MSSPRRTECSKNSKVLLLAETLGNIQVQYSGSAAVPFWKSMAINATIASRPLASLLD